ncbi:MAG: hypothetical protein HOP29_17970 [Phycisphaerales bacterium]|nr:hypothetical protein [Phycisphaerales bacterium]
MNTADVLGLVSRWIHILSAVLVVGGAAFNRFALMPAVEGVLDDQTHQRLRERIVARWKKVVHTCVALLFISGAYNFYLSFQHKVPPLPYHPMFGLKLLLALTVFYFAIALTSTSPGFARLRANGRKWLTVQITLAIIIILISGVMKTVHQSAMLSAATGAAGS